MKLSILKKKPTPYLVIYDGKISKFGTYDDALAFAGEISKRLTGRTVEIRSQGKVLTALITER